MRSSLSRSILALGSKDGEGEKRPGYSENESLRQEVCTHDPNQTELRDHPTLPRLSSLLATLSLIPAVTLLRTAQVRGLGGEMRRLQQSFDAILASFSEIATEAARERSLQRQGAHQPTSGGQLASNLGGRKTPTSRQAPILDAVQRALSKQRKERQ